MPELHADLGPVISGDWCIGCGACTGVDPTIRLEHDPERGSFGPSHPGDERAAAVCPAVRCDITELSRRAYPDGVAGEHGVIHDVWLAQSTDRDENLRASSGGIIKPVLRHLLSTSRVDGVIALGEVEGLTYRPQLCTTSEDVDRLPGSIYHVVEHSELYRLLDSTTGQLAIVGIPCQLEGLRLFTGSEAGRRHAHRIALTVGLFCGWQFTTHAIEALGTYLRFDPGDLESVSYRGGGPVGRTRIGLADGSVRTVNRRIGYAAQVAFDRSFNLPRCHVCVNHSNFLADLAVGDAWLPETAFSRTGVSIVVARNRAASEVVGELERIGAVRLAPTDPSVIERSQGRTVSYGDVAYPLAEALRAKGVPTPEITAPNADAHRPTAESEVLDLWRRIEHKRALQQQRRYRRLWLRKATVELPGLVRRLVRSRLLRRYARAVATRARDSSDAPRGDLHDFR